MTSLFPRRVTLAAAIFLGVIGASSPATAATTFLNSGDGGIGTRAITSTQVFNTEAQVFTVPVGTTDTLFESFSIFADDFLGPSGGLTFVSVPLEGFLVELDRGVPGAEDDQVRVLNADSPDQISFSTPGFSLTELIFRPRDDSGNRFSLTPGTEYAILVSAADSGESVRANTQLGYSINLGLTDREDSPSLFGATVGFGLNPGDLAISGGIDGLLAAVPSRTPLRTSIVLVPEPSVAAISMASLALLVRRRRSR